MEIQEKGMNPKQKKSETKGRGPNGGFSSRSQRIAQCSGRHTSSPLITFPRSPAHHSSVSHLLSHALSRRIISMYYRDDFVHPSDMTAATHRRRLLAIVDNNCCCVCQTKSSSRAQCGTRSPKTPWTVAKQAVSKHLHNNRGRLPTAAWHHLLLSALQS